MEPIAWRREGLHKYFISTTTTRDIQICKTEQQIQGRNAHISNPHGISSRSKQGESSCPTMPQHRTDYLEKRGIAQELPPQQPDTTNLQDGF